MALAWIMKGKDAVKLPSAAPTPGQNGATFPWQAGLSRGEQQNNRWA